jgi:hypothetical protein
MSKNPFEDMIPEAELPKEHKKQVMDSLELAGLIVDFWDLFTTKRFNTGTEMIKKIHENTKSLDQSESDNDSNLPDQNLNKDESKDAE